jgi:ubiquinone biosynthesis protein
MSILSIARTYRNLRRMKEIAQVLSRYGFGHLVVRMNLLSQIPLVSRIGRIPELPKGLTPMQDLAIRARKVLEELGPTFVKLGQVLSSRPDIVGEEFIEQFRHLQDRVTPFDSQEAKAAIMKALKTDALSVFSRFDESPLASGSIGQVHTAALTDGTEVVVKIKRPGIESAVRDDLNLLLVMAELSEHYLPELRVMRPVMVVEEFSRQLDKELDFVTEAANTAHFGAWAEGKPAVRVPKVFWDYTNRDLLCVERFEGVNIGDIESLKAKGIDVKALAGALAEGFLDQFFTAGFFHGDPHPGNLLVLEDGKIGLIDFGTVGHLTDELRGHLGTLILALLRRDVDLVVEVYRELGVFPDTLAARELKPDILEMIDRYLGVPLGKIETAGIFQDILRMGRKHQGILPRDFVILGRSLVAVASLTKRLDPAFNLVEVAKPYTQRLFLEKVSPNRLANVLMASGWSMANLLRNLPSDMAMILRMIKGGTLKGVVQHEGLDPVTAELERGSSRVSLGLLLASLVVGSALITAAGIGPKITGDIPVLGAAGFALSSLACLFLILAILRSGRV